VRTWRDSARPRIAKVIEEVGIEDIKALRKALREAYPYGERKHWPYKVWCDEIRIQLGLKRPKKPADGTLPLFGDEA